jgi:hypothetical protein
MISVILAFLSAIPGIGSIVTSITTAFFNAKVEITKAKIGGDAAVATRIVSEAAIEQQSRVSALKVVAGSRVLIWVFALYLVPPGLYQAKIYLIDKLIGPGSINLFWLWPISWQGTTDPLGNGDIAAWSNMELSFMFGSATALALGHMWFGRPNQ